MLFCFHCGSEPSGGSSHAPRPRHSSFVVCLNTGARRRNFQSELGASLGITRLHSCFVVRIWYSSSHLLQRHPFLNDTAAMVMLFCVWLHFSALQSFPLGCFTLLLTTGGESLLHILHSQENRVWRGTATVRSEAGPQTVLTPGHALQESAF